MLWNMIYGTVRRYQEDHPDWIFLRHEDISMDPAAHFRDLFEQLDLAFTPEAVPGDYVIVHVGCAISVIDEDAANQVFEALREVDGGRR